FTMNSEQILSRILDCGIVAVVRSETPEPLVNVVRALADGGVTSAEITFTVPNAPDVLREVRKAMSDSVVLGAGTVLDAESARIVVARGTQSGDRRRLLAHSRSRRPIRRDRRQIPGGRLAGLSRRSRGGYQLRMSLSLQCESSPPSVQAGRRDSSIQTDIRSH